MFKTLIRTAVVAVGMALATAPAIATPVFQGGSFGWGGAIRDTAPTSHDVTSTPLELNLSSPTLSLSGWDGSFDPLDPASITLADNPIIFNAANVDDFSWTDPGLGTFTATSVVPCTAGGNAACYDILGTFTPGSDYSNHTAFNADEKWNMTQVGGPGHTISYSGTFVALPEPLTISIFGVGLFAIGYGSLRRRKRAG